MAEIFRSDGCVVKIYSDDHAQAHVHVSSAEQEIRIDVSGLEAARLVNDRLDEVKAAWESICNGK